MTQKIIRKVALIGVLIIGTALLASSAPAAPSMSPHLKITEVYVDFAAQEILIIGQRFDNGGIPTVLLGDDPTPLTLISYSASEILVELPADLPDGDYLLTVFTGPSPLHRDSYDLTFRAVEPQEDPGAQNAALGLIVQAPVLDCTVGDVITCEEKATLLVSVPYGTVVEFENLVVSTVWILGEWVTVEEIFNFKLENPDPPGPGGRRIHAEISLDGTLFDELELRPDQPVVKLQSGPDVRMQLVSNTLVSIVMDDGELKNVITEVEGDVSSTIVRPYAADDRQAQIEVEIVNDGDIFATYIVTVSECSGDIAQVPFQFVNVEPGPASAETLLFDLRTDTAFAAGDTCVVRIKAPTGRIFRELEVTFPGPSS